MLCLGCERAPKHFAPSSLEELGYFAFGGSTLVVLTKPGVLELDADLVANSEKKVAMNVVRGGGWGARGPQTRATLQFG